MSIDKWRNKYCEPTMTAPTEQAFLIELDRKLWTAPDKLRAGCPTDVYTT
jgi:hypothetical protein